MAVPYFGSQTELEALEVRLRSSGESSPAHLQADLAWCLRERDPVRAAGLARAALSARPAGDPASNTALQAAVRARAELVLAHVSYLDDDIPAAESGTARALAGFESAGDDIGAGDVRVLVGTLKTLDGAVARWREDAQLAARAYARAGDSARQAVADAILAYAGVFEDGPGARALFERSPTVSLHTDDAYVLSMKESVWAASEPVGPLKAAYYQRAFQSALEAGAMKNAGFLAINVCANLGNLYDLAGSLTWAQTAFDIARRCAIRRIAAPALACLTDTLAKLGRTEEALQIQQQIEPLVSERMRAGRQWGQICSIRAAVAIRRQEHELALRDLQEAEAIFRRSNEANDLTHLLPFKAEALAHLGRESEAVAAAEAVLAKSVRGAPAPFERARAHHALAVVWRRRRSTEQTIAQMEAALSEMASSGVAIEIPDWLAELSRDHEEAGDFPRALDCERKAAVARVALQEKQASDMATGLQVRYETERARAEASHHKALAEAESRRADAEAKANRAKSTFLANMSHELRSPLNAMIGFTRLLLRNPGLAAYREDLGVVFRSGEHLHGLINQVLDMSKIEAGHANLVESEFDLHLMLEELREMFSVQARQHGVALEVVCAGAVPSHVRGDALKLRQVLINLLGNALKFTPHGRVALEVAGVEPGRIEFIVRDTGLGIAPEDLARLGRPFVQSATGERMADGTGLGLAISRGFVELMGGTLDLSSVPAEGTCAGFSIRLEEVAASSVAATPGAGAGRRPVMLAPGTPPVRVLVVDDRVEARLLLLRLLQPLGFEVREAEDGEQALAAWRQWQPRMVMMDMRMPVMDGMEATRRIKATEQGRGTAVIALTASSFEEQREDILAAGCDAFLRKPLREEEVLETIARWAGVSYVYGEDASAPATPASADPGPQQLARVPRMLRDRLSRSLHLLDVEAIETALQEMRQHDPACADAFAPLARRFQYERIADLLVKAAD